MLPVGLFEGMGRNDLCRQPQNVRVRFVCRAGLFHRGTLSHVPASLQRGRSAPCLPNAARHVTIQSRPCPSPESVITSFTTLTLADHDGHRDLPGQTAPLPVCVIVGDVLGTLIYHHRTLETLFYEAGAAGEVPEGNCVTKCQSWLKRMHGDVDDPAAVLGKVLKEFMEVDRSYDDRQETGRKRITEALARFGLSYHRGGLILGAAAALPTKSLTEGPGRGCVARPVGAADLHLAPPVPRSRRRLLSMPS